MLKQRRLKLVPLEVVIPLYRGLRLGLDAHVPHHCGGSTLLLLLLLQRSQPTRYVLGSCIGCVGERGGGGGLRRGRELVGEACPARPTLVATVTAEGSARCHGLRWMWW